MKYYSTQRPVGPGTYPRGGVIEIVNFDYRQPVESIDRPAWGYIEYNRELTPEEIRNYELTPEKDGLTIEDFREKGDPFFFDEQIETMTDYIKQELASGPDTATESALVERMLLDISDAVMTEENPIENLETLCGPGVTADQVEALQQQIMIEW